MKIPVLILRHHMLLARAACDMHLNSYFKAYDFPVIFTRAANVYGSCQQLYRIIPKTF